MATPNRAALLTRTIKVLRKYYKPVTPAKDRSLFDHLLFACLLEDSSHESAEQVFETLKEDYFDWNEVRVSTIRELTDVMKPLVNPGQAATRLKQTLHSVYESVYQFDIESLKKQNIGQAASQLERYRGTTPFVVAYVTQTALGGHAIPVNRGLLVALHAIGMVTDEEFQKGVVPGLERNVPKAKGAEISSLLHQLGVEVGRNPQGQTSRKLLLEIAPDAKDRLPKRRTHRPKVKPAADEAAAAAKQAPAAADAARKQAPKAAKPASEKPAKKAKQKRPTRRPAAAKKKSAKAAKRPTKKGAGRRLTKKKPR